jgi:hypothetical protein
VSWERLWKARRMPEVMGLGTLRNVSSEYGETCDHILRTFAVITSLSDSGYLSL